jgi:hypothetical protein
MPIGFQNQMQRQENEERILGTEHSPSSSLRKSPPSSLFPCQFFLCITALCFQRIEAEDSYDLPPINYSVAIPSNAVTRLQGEIDSGRVQLDSTSSQGYLPSVLKALKISYSSQCLVFSKTSLQLRRISPQYPRAIYFNDESYVGWTQYGDVVEVSVADPDLGAVFYTLDQKVKERPQFIRRTHDCLSCHGATMTQNIPGHLVRSVFPDSKGHPILKAGSSITTQNSRFDERWGGWYVTGTHGRERHMGNVIARPIDQGAIFESATGNNVTDLRPFFNTSPYLTPHSDIVALLVLEHQTEMHNLMTRANLEVSKALFRQEHLNAALDRPKDYMTQHTMKIIESYGERLLRYMLFADEPELRSRVEGTSGFTEEFRTLGPYDSLGRSLRELDLNERVFKFPCSYLIYSDSFDQLPVLVRNHVYRRLYDILTLAIEDDFDDLTRAQRKTIYQILLETKKGVPTYWK